MCPDCSGVKGATDTAGEGLAGASGCRGVAVASGWLAGLAGASGDSVAEGLVGGRGALVAGQALSRTVKQADSRNILFCMGDNSQWFGHFFEESGARPLD